VCVCVCVCVCVEVGVYARNSDGARQSEKKNVIELNQKHPELSEGVGRSSRLVLGNLFLFI